MPIMSSADASDSVNESVIDDSWLIRSSDAYADEYRDCRALKSRFQQYFVDGVTTDCSPWKRDWDNSVKWEATKDNKAGKEIVESEKQRRRDRLRPHFENTVWQKRQSPPEDWNRPLPDHMQKEYANTYLALKNRELKGEIETTIDSKCSIM